MRASWNSRRRGFGVCSSRPLAQEGASMLVLSRQRDETVMIGDDVEVTVVDIRGDKVRLGIVAPKEISVHRKEVYDAIRRENRAAAQISPEDLAGVNLPESIRRRLQVAPPSGV